MYYSNVSFQECLGILAARHTSYLHDKFPLFASAIRRTPLAGVPWQAISDGGLTPATDIKLLLTACRGGSHLPSDIYIIKNNYHFHTAAAVRYLYPFQYTAKDITNTSSTSIMQQLHISLK